MRLVKVSAPRGRAGDIARVALLQSTSTREITRPVPAPIIDIAASENVKFGIPRARRPRRRVSACAHPRMDGLSLVYGFDGTQSEKLTSFAISIVALVAGAIAVYGCMFARGELSYAAARNKES